MDFDASGAAGILGDGTAAGDGADAGAGGGDAAAAAAAAAGAGDAAAGGADGGAGDGDLPDWVKSLSADGGDADSPSNRDWVASKKFKDQDGLVKALRDTEKALRDGGRVKVPGEGAGTEEVAAFHKAIGVPDDPKGYEVKLPETNGGLELNGDLIGKLAEIAHAAGTPKGAFEAIANAYVAQQVEDHLAEVSRQDELTQAQLKEWGASKDAKLADCQAAQRALGIDRTMVAQLQGAWGSDKTLAFLAKIGGGIAEDTLVTGGTGRFGVTAAEAQREVDAIKADPVRAAAVAKPGSPESIRWNSLLAVIGAEKDRQQNAA
tara:strand:- start:3549 stop:4508 length:960 start_codon:yes stop_codon:yes gene_type:complete